jgi:hypothetical protein
MIFRENIKCGNYGGKYNEKKNYFGPENVGGGEINKDNQIYPKDSGKNNKLFIHGFEGCFRFLRF